MIPYKFIAEKMLVRSVVVTIAKKKNSKNVSDMYNGHYKTPKRQETPNIETSAMLVE